MAANPPSPIRLHAFALLSGIGWVLDFTVFNLLSLAGMSLFVANVAGAVCGVSFVFVTARRFIFRNIRTDLRTAVLAYVAWNVVGIALASWAVAAVGVLLAAPLVAGPIQHLLAQAGIGIGWSVLIPPAAKILVTPATMYLNFLAMGVIVERRFSFL